MTRLTAAAPQPVSRAARRRQAKTAVLVALYGRERVAESRHEPLPDVEYPGHCNVCWHEVDAPRHQRRRPWWRGPRRAPAGDPAQREGWR